MKKIAMLLGLLMIFGMLSITPVSAAVETDATIQLIADKTEVKVGETVTVTVKFIGESENYRDGDTYGIKSAKIVPTWNVEEFEYVSGENDSGTINGLYTKDPSLTETTKTSGYVTFNQGTDSADETYYTGDFIFGTITLKALKVADAASISVKSTSSVKLNVVGGKTTNQANVTTGTAATVKIVAAGSTDIIVDDEDFSSATEDNYTSKDVTSGNVKVGENTPIAMGEGGKIYTYFNKTATTLEAGKYGIDATINGKKFRFPGKVDVTIASGETEAKWAIKLVIPTGKFSDNVAASVTDIADYYITD